MITREISYSGGSVVLGCSALVPRMYRLRFGRDLVRDMARLSAGLKRLHALPEDATEEERINAQFDVLDLELFENVAWVMAKHASPDTVPNVPDEWLMSMDGAFPIYEILPGIIELWGLNNKTTSIPKKK